MNHQDAHFLNRFEALAIGPGEFSHVAHLRLAFLYIEQGGVEAAVGHMSAGLQRFVEKVGAVDKYHQTITEALVRLMGARLDQQPTPDWHSFLQANPDLVQDAKGVLLRHYSPARLNCAEARAKFLPPDRLPLER